MTSSFDNDQQAIVLPELVVESGVFPVFGGSAFSDPIGTIRTAAR